MKSLINHVLIDTLIGDLTIVIVSNAKKQKSIFSDFFEKLNAHIIYLDSYDECLEFYKTHPVDIIFIDLNIDTFNPFKLIDEIKMEKPLQYIIGISNKDSKEILYKCIQYNLNDFMLNSFEMFELKDSILRYLDKKVATNKISDVLEENYQNLTPKEVIQSLLEKNRTKVDLVGQYKGIPIIKKATLIEMSSESVLLKIDDIHKHILNYSKKIIISSVYLSYDIYAILSHIDNKNNIATFDKLEFINSYIHHRKHVRIVPDEHFHIILEINGRKHKSTILNISEGYALLKMNKLHEHIHPSAKVKMYISFTMHSLFANSKHKAHSFTTVASVVDIFDVKDYHKVLFQFDLIDLDKKLLKDYINKRGVELVKEFKKKYIPKRSIKAV